MLHLDAGFYWIVPASLFPSFSLSLFLSLQLPHFVPPSLCLSPSRPFTRSPPLSLSLYLGLSVYVYVSLSMPLSRSATLCDGAYRILKKPTPPCKKVPHPSKPFEKGDTSNTSTSTSRQLQLDSSSTDSALGAELKTPNISSLLHI